MSRRMPPRGFFNGESPFGRLPTEPSFPTIRISRSAVGWIVGIAIALLLLFLLKPFATLYTDYLWFRALNYGGVFGTRFTAQIWSFFIFAILFWAIGAANVLVALQSSGRRLSSIGIRQRLLTAPSTILALLVVFLLGLLFGQIASSQWQTILTFLNQKPFNVRDPIWHEDVAFYVFTLPFYRFLWGWLLGVDILMMLGVAALYASRVGLQNLVFPVRAIRHISILAAAFAVLLAVHYRLDLYELLLSKRGFVFGVGAADVAARIPAYWIMTVLMVLIAVGLLVSAGQARLASLPAALVVWLGAAFVLLVLFPGVVQQFQVKPNEITRETPYIKNEIQFTRQAYGLSEVTDRPFTPSDTLTGDVLARNPQTVQNARLWDPQLALPFTLENLQSLRTYYQFYDRDIAVDRYQLGDQYLQLLLAARELKPENLPPNVQNWVNLKLQYTHGYGAVAARANQATPQGDPVLTLHDIPPSGVPQVTQPGIYFGRHTTSYVLTDSKQPELDYSTGQLEEYTQWKGKTGVPLSSALRSLAFAIRFGDLNLLISPQLTSQTQVLFNRAVQDRVSALAPFLQFDQDPYVVIVDGKIYWILDGFTITDHYPYSEIAPDDAGPLAGVNYARNSVKVVVNAYDGTTTFYQIDSNDAIANTYGAIFPGLFKPISAMPDGLRAHIRYPRDLFNLQAQRFTLFHITDPNTFFTREDLWSIAKENLVQAGGLSTMRPFYLIMRLPGEPKEEFVTILPYTPNGKTNMIAYLAARSDQPDYGTLFDFRFPRATLVTGPQQVEANIDQAPLIKSQFALLNATGSQVIRGNLLVIPIETSLLYIEPIYLQSSNVAKPQLKKVIAATGQNVVMEDTLDKALASLLGVAPPSAPSGPSGPAPSGTVAQLISQAKQHYDLAQSALRNNDFVTYAKEIKTVGDILNQLAALQSGSPSASASPKASPTASP